MQSELLEVDMAHSGLLKTSIAGEGVRMRTSDCSPDLAKPSPSSFRSWVLC